MHIYSVHSHGIAFRGRLTPVLQLDIHESKYQVHHASDQLHQARGHLFRSMPRCLATEVRVELHVVGECGLRVGQVEECVDEGFFGEDLVDDLRQSGLVELQ